MGPKKGDQMTTALKTILAAAYMLAAMPITAQVERLPLDRDLWREG
jgi:hypothetical protein